MYLKHGYVTELGVRVILFNHYISELPLNCTTLVYGTPYPP